MKIIRIPFYVSNKRARLRESPGLYECPRAPDCVRMSIMVFEVVQIKFLMVRYIVQRTINQYIALRFVYY